VARDGNRAEDAAVEEVLRGDLEESVELAPAEAPIELVHQ
jgi:hypothetical protein